MPGLNRKGPIGEGAMTGRRMGRCNPENRGKSDEEIILSRSTFVSTGQVSGRGQGRGLGRGQGQGFGKGQGRGLGMRFRGNA